MVCQRSWRSDDQDLGSCFRIFAPHIDRTHLNSARSRGVTSTPIPLLLRRGQDGQVLGLGNQQSHPPLPRSSKRCIHTRASPHTRRPGHRRARRRGTSMGHAHPKQHPCPERPSSDRHRCQMPRNRPPSHHLLPRHNRPTLGPRCRKDYHITHTPQEGRPRLGRPPHRMDLCQR